jgi:selenocysteine-specific elongation factor
MHVIGTAGHVDHGKSTLIAALTGTHPDRLKEEQEREMTIELGFAWLNLPNGEEVGIIDVPGHRDFIGNMLAGIGGIDAVLLVIAADEGVMPQTREHLAILDLLQIRTGIVVLTKIDVIDDPAWLDLIEGDIHSILTGTVLANAPLVRVSSRTKAGIKDLINLLSSVLENTPARPDLGRPRLPIDRVFSISGFGTVVTGTLQDGKLQTGEEIEIQPAGLTGRIRGLQGHNKKEGIALAGSRTAINISGLNVEEINRGDVVVHPGQYHPGRILDVNFRLLPDVNGPIRHGSEIKLFIGTSETIAKIRLLGVETLEPGQSGWLQLELRSPVIALRGDRFILRRPSPSETLGGGTVVDPQPKNRHKRFSLDEIKKLETLQRGSPADILLQSSLALGPVLLKDVIFRSRLSNEQAQDAYEKLRVEGQIICLEGEESTASKEKLIISLIHWNDITDQIFQIINDYHHNQPLKPGILREELKSRLKLSTHINNLILSKLVSSGDIVEKGSFISKPGFEITYTLQQQASIKKLMERFTQSPFSPPSIKECQDEIGENVLNALIEVGEFKQVSSDVIFRSKDYESLVTKTKQFLDQNGKITVAEARDLFGTSRRYILALFEYLDSIAITIRDGDVRRLRR